MVFWTAKNILSSFNLLTGMSVMHLWTEIVRRTRKKDRNMTPPPWVMKMGHLVKYRGRGIEKVGWSEKWDGFSDCNPSLLQPQRPGQINWLDPNQHHLIWTRHTDGLINDINRLWKGEWKSVNCIILSLPQRKSVYLFQIFLPIKMSIVVIITLHLI